MREQPQAALHLTLLAVLLTSGSALAQPAPRQFAIPGHGSLELNVPVGWRVADKSLADPPAVAIGMRPTSGDAFNLQITSVRLDPAKMAGTTPPSMKERTQGLAKKLLATSVETTAEVLELRGKNTL